MDGTTTKILIPHVLTLTFDNIHNNNIASPGQRALWRTLGLGVISMSPSSTLNQPTDYMFQEALDLFL
jgi:hypothetical protein